MRRGEHLVSFPPHLSHGERVRLMFEWEPQNVPPGELADWVRYRDAHQTVQYGNLEIKRTGPSGFLIIVAGLDAQVPAESVDEMVVLVNRLMEKWT